jgi:hypothetical protein
VYKQFSNIFNISPIDTTGLTSKSKITINFTISGTTIGQSSIIIGNNLIMNNLNTYSPDIMFYFSDDKVCGILRYINNNSAVQKIYPSNTILKNIVNLKKMIYNIVITLSNFGVPTIDPLNGSSINGSPFKKLCNLSMKLTTSSSLSFGPGPETTLLNNVVTWYDNMNLNNIIFYNNDGNLINVSNLNIIKSL